MTSYNQFVCFKHTHLLKKKKKRKRTYSRAEEGLSFCSYTFGLALLTSLKELGNVCSRKKEWLMAQKMLENGLSFFPLHNKQEIRKREISVLRNLLGKMMLLTIMINWIVVCFCH